MEFLLGSKEEFWKFVDSITKNENIAIIGHNDLDGVASVIFLEEILKYKKIKVKSIFFASYKKDMFQEITPDFEKKSISKIFLVDIYDGSDSEGFHNLKNKFDIFTIDHHPIQNKNEKNMIKTPSSDCSSLTIYDLGKQMIDKKLKWLLYSAMIADMSFANPKNMEVIKKDYPDLDTNKKIMDSIFGETAKSISSALVFFKGDIKKIYDMIKNKEINKFGEYRRIIDSEIEKAKEDFRKNAEYFPEKKMYIYYFEPEHNISSILSTILSIEEPEKTFVIIAPIKEDLLKLSARNQICNLDTGALLKKGIRGLQNAVAGGHIPASGGTIQKKDLNKFKENILE